MDLILSALALAGLVILGLATFYAVGIYNGLIQARQNVAKAWGDVDVLLRQRHDELPSLVQVCKGSALHEADTLERITKLRAEYEQTADSTGKAAVENRLNQELTLFRTRVEAYPGLKANENFLRLQERISRLEDGIAARREFFNDCVRVFNTLCEQFPSRLVARGMKAAPHAYLEASAAQREGVRTEFGG